MFVGKRTTEELQRMVVIHPCILHSNTTIAQIVQPTSWRDKIHAQRQKEGHKAYLLFMVVLSLFLYQR